jgi:predicted nucleotidyltransferase
MLNLIILNPPLRRKVIPMNREDVIRALKTLMDRKGDEYDIVRIGLFGSIARGVMHEGSDVDVVVVLGKPDMFNLIAIKQDLEAQLDCRVDLVRYRGKMNPFLKKRIDREAFYV